MTYETIESNVNGWITTCIYKPTDGTLHEPNKLTEDCRSVSLLDHAAVIDDKVFVCAGTRVGGAKRVVGNNSAGLLTEAPRGHGCSHIDSAVD